MPENSLEGFLYATKLGVNTLEMDVVISIDKKVVVSHDQHINTTICLDESGTALDKDSSISVYQLKYKEIKKFDCGSAGNPNYPEQQKTPVSKPLLSVVLKTVYKDNPNMNYNIEIKSSPKGDNSLHPSFETYSELVFKSIRKIPAQHITIQSFDQRVMKYWRDNHPEYKIAFLVGSNTADNNIEKLGFLPDIYSPYFKIITREEVESLHNRSVRVIPWTVNNIDDMKRLIDMEVDGIITDYPNRLLNLLE